MKTSADRWLLDYFRLDRKTGVVMWATEQELRDEPPKRWKRIPFGEPAGGRDVMRHGKVVSFSGRNLLTCDIKEAILQGYQWPWDAATPYTVPGETFRKPDNNRARAQLMMQRWHLVGDAVHWTASPHSTIPAGSKVKGVMIAGRNEIMVTSGGSGYMLNDILHVLHRHCLPGEPCALRWD